MLPAQHGALHDRAARALTVDHDKTRSVVLDLKVLATHQVWLARFRKVHLVRARTARLSTIHEGPGRGAWWSPRIPPEPEREDRDRELVPAERGLGLGSESYQDRPGLPRRRHRSPVVIRGGSGDASRPPALHGRPTWFETSSFEASSFETSPSRLASPTPRPTCSRSPRRSRPAAS